MINTKHFLEYMIGNGLDFFTAASGCGMAGRTGDMGAAAVNGINLGDNFKYILSNNGAHESVGGQPTVGFDIHMPEVFRGCGFEHVYTAFHEKEVKQGMEFLRSHPKAAMIIYVKLGSGNDLGRPSLLPQENKKLLMEKLLK